MTTCFLWFVLTYPHRLSLHLNASSILSLKISINYLLVVDKRLQPTSDGKIAWTEIQRMSWPGDLQAVKAQLVIVISVVLKAATHMQYFANIGQITSSV